MFQDFEDAIEGIANFGVVAYIDGETTVAILAPDDMAIGEENVGDLLPVVSAGFDVEGGEVFGAEEIGIDGERADGGVVAILSEVIEFDVVGECIAAGGVEELSVAGVAVVVAALCLVGADFGEFGGGIDELVGAGAEENVGLRREVLLQQQAECDGLTATQREKARGRTGRGI